MSNKLNRSELITNRLIECHQKGELYTHDVVKILNHFAKELNLSTNSAAARVRRISPAGMQKRIEAGKEMVVNLNGSKLVAII